MDLVTKLVIGSLIVGGENILIKFVNFSKLNRQVYLILSEEKR